MINTIASPHAYNVVSEEFLKAINGKIVKPGEYNTFLSPYFIDEDVVDYFESMGLTAYGWSPTIHDLMYNLMLATAEAAELRVNMNTDAVNFSSPNGVLELDYTADIRAYIIKLFESILGVDKISVAGNSNIFQTVNAYNFINVRFGYSGSFLRKLKAIGCTFFNSSIGFVREITGCWITDSVIEVIEGMEMNGTIVVNTQFKGSGKIVLIDAISSQKYKLFKDCTFDSGISFVALDGSTISIEGR